jgi:ketosteroid isomerase-like protein
MSRENVEVLRRAYDAWSRGDMDVLLAQFHPAVEFRPAGVWSGLDAIYRGHEGIRKLWHDFRQVWDSIEQVPERFYEKDGHVVMLWRMDARGRGGVVVRHRGGHVVRFRDGLIASIQAYEDWATTLEAVGLRE